MKMQGRETRTEIQYYDDIAVKVKWKIIGE